MRVLRARWANTAMLNGGASDFGPLPHLFRTKCPRRHLFRVFGVPVHKRVLNG